MKLTLTTAAIAFAFAGMAQAQTTPPSGTGADRPAASPTTRTDANRGSTRAERKAKDAEEERIESEYKAAKEKCDAMQGNAKDVCEKEAKGKEKVAKAELDAKKNPSERNQRKVQEAKIDADYDVAKEKCDDLKGNEKDACEKDAKAKRDQAKAQFAKTKARRDNATSGATAERRPAGSAK
jgi:hypothetical protein